MESIRKTYTSNQVDLMNLIRKLWEEHVVWTRLFIISTLSDLPDLKETTNRLLQNPEDFAKAFAPFYGPEKTQQFKKIFTEHLTIGGELVSATKSGDKVKADIIRKRWYKNAYELAAFFSAANPYWDRKKWQEMLYEHLKMTENEVGYRLKGQYEKDVVNYGNIENEAMKMADYMSEGILAQYAKYI